MPVDLLEDFNLSNESGPTDLLADYIAPPKEVGFKAVANDAWKGAKQAFPAAGRMFKALPGQVGDIVNSEDPYTKERAGKVALAGFASGGRGLLNAPANVVDYLKNKEIIPDWVDAWRPEELNKVNYKKELGVNDDRAGDELIGGAAELLPNGAFRSLAPAAWAIGQNENPVTAQLIPSAIKTTIKAPGVIGKVAKKAIGYKSAEHIAEKIAHTDLNHMLDHAKQGYSSLFEKAAEKGITKAEIKRTHAIEVFKNMTPDERAVVSKAFKTQKLPDIHDGYKELGKFVADLKAKKLKSGLAPNEKIVLAKAQHVRANFKDALNSAFEQSGNADKFSTLNSYWEKEVVPNLYNPDLVKFRSGDLTAERLVEKLNKNDKFKARLAKKYPEVEKNQFIKGLKPKAKILGTAASLYGLFK